MFDRKKILSNVDTMTKQVRQILEQLERWQVQKITWFYCHAAFKGEALFLQVLVYKWHQSFVTAPTDLRWYLVSYHNINIISVYCPALLRVCKKQRNTWSTKSSYVLCNLPNYCTLLKNSATQWAFINSAASSSSYCNIPCFDYLTTAQRLALNCCSADCEKLNKAQITSEEKNIFK